MFSNLSRRTRTVLALVGAVVTLGAIALGIVLTNEQARTNLELQVAYILPGPIVNGCQLKPLAQCANVNLRNAKLNGLNLTWANLSGADLDGADLSHTRLTGANLTGARLVRAKLNDTDLSRADLTRARVYYGELRRVNLTGTNLRGAFLYCADFAPDSTFASTKTSNGVVVNSYSEWRLKCKGLAFPFASDAAGVTIPCGGPDVPRVVDKEARHAAASDYEPMDLVDIGIFGVPLAEGASARLMRYDAAAAFAQMAFAAQSEGYTIQALSGYRSFARQDAVFSSWVKSEMDDAQKAGLSIPPDEAVTRANRYSAMAGHSEHQLGTVMDISTPGLEDPFDEVAVAQTDAAKWLAAHAHEYGFAFSYPEGKEKLTGYKWEPWHLRWIGVADANDLFKREYLNPANEITPARYLSQKMSLRDCSTIP